MKPLISFLILAAPLMAQPPIIPLQPNQQINQSYQNINRNFYYLDAKSVVCVGIGVNSISCNSNPAVTLSIYPLTQYNPGMIVALTAASSNTGPATINIAGIGAVPILSASGAALTAGQIAAGTTYSLDYNGSAFIITGGSGGSGGGGVQSVGLSLPNIFSISGSPVVSTGTLTGTFVNQSPNLVFAGPCSGTGTPIFRGLCSADIPNNTANTTGNALTATTAANALALNGAAVPISNTCVGTNSLGQIVTGICSGSGMPGGAGGQIQYNNGGVFGGFSPQVNGTGITTPSGLNFLNSSPFNGLTFTFSNPSAGGVQLGATGTLGNGGLTNSATTVNSQTCTLGASCTVTVPVGSGVTGLGTGIAAFLATPSSANLLAAMTTSTGNGNLVFGTSPTLVTPNIGTPASGVATNLTGLPLTSGVTGILPAGNGGTGVANTATLTLGTTSHNYATLGTGPIKNTTTTGAFSIATASDIFGLWSGTCNSTTYLRGDGSCSTPSGTGGGTVNSVSGTFTGGLISIAGSPITNTGTLAFTVAGTSGGVPYFSSTTGWASSGLLGGGQFVLGGGAGSAPTTSFSIIPITNGGTGTASTLTGLVRGNSSAMTAAELSNDATTSGSNAVTVKGINGTLLSGLATGLLKNTTGTGVPSIATAGTDYVVPSGNITGTAGNLSGTPALPNGVTATTQSPGDNSTKLATDAFVAAATSAAVTGSYPVAGVSGGVTVAGTNLQTGTGAVSRTATNKMNDFISPADFGASGSTTTDATVGTLTSGATSVTLSSGTSFKTGYGISIVGAGTSGAVYVGTITGGTAPTFTISPATSTTVTTGQSVTHDDGAAVQLTISACPSGGSVYFGGANITYQVSASTTPTLQGNCTYYGAASIIQMSANNQAVNVAASATNVTIQDLTFSGGGFFVANGTVSNLSIQHVTIKNITSTAYPFHLAFYASYALTNSSITGSTFSNVGGGIQTATVHGFKADRNVISGPASCGILADLIYMNNSGTTVTDPNTSSDYSITNNSLTGSCRIGIEVQGTNADTARILNNDISAWNSGSSTSLSFGISIDLNNSGVGSSAEVASNKITGAGTNAANTQIGIELASPYINVHDNEVINFHNALVWDNSLNGNCQVTNNRLIASGVTMNFSGDGSHCLISGNQIIEPSGTAMYIQAGTAAFTVFENNSIQRTPASTDSGTLLLWAIGASSYPRTFRSNPVTLLAGTVPGGVYYTGFSQGSNVPGTIFDNNNVSNFTGHTGVSTGFQCSGVTGFDGSTIQNSTLYNVDYPIYCNSGAGVGSAAILVSNNVAAGSTPSSYLTTGSNIQPQTGASLPTVCNVGQVFFLTGVTAGQNWYGCTAPNTWTLEGGGGGGGSGLPIQANGSAVATATTLNMIPGTYITQSVSNSSGTVSYQPDVDTSKIARFSDIQTGQALYAVATSSSPTAYVAAVQLSPSTFVLSAGQTVNLNFGSTGCTGGVATTLTLGSLATKPIYSGPTGTTYPASTQCGANAIVPLIYDAVTPAFRMPAASSGGTHTVLNEQTFWMAGATLGSTTLSTNGLVASGSASGGFLFNYPATGWPGAINLANSGSIFAQVVMPVPTNWAGALTVKTLYGLANSTPTGTGSHTYQAACWTPGTTNWSSAPPFIGSPVTVGFSFTGTVYQTGISDSVTSIPTTGCTAGQMMFIRMTRTSSGTATDPTSLIYIDVSLPYTN